MNIDDILEMLDDLLDKAPGVPFSGKKAVVDAEKMRDLINDIRLNLPQEIKQAKLIVMDRKTILSDAQKEAEALVHKAEDRVKAMVAQDEIVKAAKEKGIELMKTAQGRAKEVQQVANKYVDDALLSTEEMLTRHLVEVKQARQAIRLNSKNPNPNG